MWATFGAGTNEKPEGMELRCECSFLEGFTRCGLLSDQALL